MSPRRDPLEGKFNGASRAAVDSFKRRSEAITAELNASLRAILGGQQGMDTSFTTGDHKQQGNARQNMGCANVGATRFGAC